MTGNFADERRIAVEGDGSHVNKGRAQLQNMQGTPKTCATTQFIKCRPSKQTPETVFHNVPRNLKSGLPWGFLGVVIATKCVLYVTQ